MTKLTQKGRATQIVQFLACAASGGLVVLGLLGTQYQWPPLSVWGGAAWIIFTYGTTSLIAFLAYGYDKWMAHLKQWRIAEMALHVVALSGGWPGAFVAQQVFRHKTDWGNQSGFKVITWLIAFAHLVFWGIWLYFRPFSF